MTRTAPSAASAWLSGLVLGAVSGLALLALGTIGLALVVASALLILVKGPRALPAAGFVSGLGLVWTALLARVALTCVAPGCEAGDIGGWVAKAATIFVIGLVASAFALRRSAST